MLLNGIYVSCLFFHAFIAFLQQNMNQMFQVNKAMPSKESIKKRVRRDKPSDDTSGSGVLEQVSKKPRLEKEDKTTISDESSTTTAAADPVAAVVSSSGSEKPPSALDVTQRWLVEKLTPEKVSNLVMVTMVSLRGICGDCISAIESTSLHVTHHLNVLRFHQLLSQHYS